MVYFQAEVILANVLRHNYFVTRRDVAQYCKRVKEAILVKTGEQYAYFEMNDDSIEVALRKYEDIWEEKGNMIYGKKNYKLEYFNNRIAKEAAEILEEESKKLKKCICAERCDCENPPPDDWKGKNGAYRVNEECLIHNLFPKPHRDCLAHSTYRVW